MENKDIFSNAFLIDNVGSPCFLGIAVGYFAKKMFKTVLFLGGGITVILFVSEYYGVVKVSDSQLLHATNMATQLAKNSSDFLMERLSHFTVKSVSATGGFALGFKMG